MSLVALKRKYEAIRKNTGAGSGINRSVVTPSASLAMKNLSNTRSENKTYFITPNVSSSNYTQKVKSDTLYGETNCQPQVINTTNCANRPNNAPINITKKVCNVHQNTTVDKSSEYIERVKQGCTRNEQLPRIPGIGTKC